MRSVAEKKYFDTTRGIGPFGAVLINSLTEVIPGTTDTTRIGDKIHIHSIELRGMLNMNIVAGDVLDVPYRVIIFQWKDDSTPGVNDILETASVYSAFDHDRKIKRRILYERCGVFSVKNVQYYTIANKISTPLKAFINLKRSVNGGIQVNFQTAVTTGVNKIYMMVIIDDADTIGLVYNVRINYTDL